MSDTPKRRFWQIHLSTILLMSFAAAGLLGANLAKRSQISEQGAFRSELHEWGWPYAYDKVSLGYNGVEGDPECAILERNNQRHIFLNTSCCLFLVFSLALTSEYFIRRQPNKP